MESRKKTHHTFFSNLSTPLKIDIIAVLNEKGRERGLCVNELSEELKVEQSKLSHALSGLKRCNLLKVNRKGKHRIYSLNKETMIPILEIIDKHARKNCGGSCRNCAFK